MAQFWRLLLLFATHSVHFANGDSAYELKANRDCKRVTQKRFPDAVCSEKPDSRACTEWCAEMSDQKCPLGSSGKMLKVTCKRADKHEGDQTCCCTMRCKPKTSNSWRKGKEPEQGKDSPDGRTAGMDGELDEDMMNTLGGHDTGICLKGSRKEIKTELSKACRSSPKVSVARKYCLDELGGIYYCLTKGTCVGWRCKGCVQHECNYEGVSKVIYPPSSYVKDHLKEQENSQGEGKSEKDTSHSQSVKEKDDPLISGVWCIDISQEHACSEVCDRFGNRWCMSRPKEMSVTSEGCDGTFGTKCKCCCLPKCDPHSFDCEQAATYFGKEKKLGKAKIRHRGSEPAKTTSKKPKDSRDNSNKKMLGKAKNTDQGSEQQVNTGEKPEDSRDKSKKNTLGKAKNRDKGSKQQDNTSAKPKDKSKKSKDTSFPGYDQDYGENPKEPDMTLPSQEQDNSYRDSEISGL